MHASMRECEVNVSSASVLKPDSSCSPSPPPPNPESEWEQVPPEGQELSVVLEDFPGEGPVLQADHKPVRHTHTHARQTHSHTYIYHHNSKDSVNFPPKQILNGHHCGLHNIIVTRRASGYHCALHARARASG